MQSTNLQSNYGCYQQDQPEVIQLTKHQDASYTL